MKFKKNVRPEAKRAAKKLIDEYRIDDAGGMELIGAFADAYSLELDAMDIITREGLVICDRFGQKKAHPLCCVIRDARAQKMAALKGMNLDVEPLAERPGRQ